MNRDELNKLSRLILRSAMEVHRQIGPGLLESVYEICLEDELKSHGLDCKRQVVVPYIL